MTVTLSATQARNLLKRELREARRYSVARVPFLLSVQRAWKGKDYAAHMIDALKEVIADYDAREETSHQYISKYLLHSITLEGIHSAFAMTEQGKPIIVSEIAAGLGHGYLRVFGFNATSPSPRDITEEIALFLDGLYYCTYEPVKVTRPVKATYHAICWDSLNEKSLMETLMDVMGKHVLTYSVW